MGHHINPIVGYINSGICSCVSLGLVEIPLIMAIRYVGV